MITVFAIACVAIGLIFMDFRLRSYRLAHGKRKNAVFSDAYIKRAARFVLLTVRKLARCRFDFDSGGFSLPRQFLLIANHQSLVDIPNLVYFFPENGLRFISKQELGRLVPFVSLMLRTQRHCLIARQSNLAQSMKAIQRFAERVARSDVCPVVYPEGTRSANGAVQEFRTAGIRKLLETARLPIVVVAEDGGFRISTLKLAFSFLRGNRYRTKILAVLPPPESKSEILRSIGKAQELISAQISDWHAG
jgi:1-acyl-sn-glycerol-3-phosphate acyltransferase